MQWATKQKGFTIVELLIVVVVIAILATITIIAYNGIQNRAKASAAQAAASQAAKKVALWQVDNSGSSPDETTFNSLLGPNSSGTTYEYSPGSNGTFCITATANNVSYFTSGGSPVAGGCPGHGQNGVAAITNWALNPSAVGSTSGFAQAGSSPAANSLSISGIQYHHVSTSLKRDITGSGQTGASVQTPSGLARPRVNAGQAFSWSLWVYSTKAGTISPYCDGVKVSDGTSAGLGGSGVAVPANTWTKMTSTITATVDMYVSQCGGYNLAVVSGDTVWFDEFMLNLGPAASYADGSTTNWLWSGTANASTSYGPAV